MKRKRWIAVRFDDICPTMDWEAFHKATELMDKYHIHPLLGVIPNNQDKELFIDPPRQDYWDCLKSLQSKGYILAMHGVYHKYTQFSKRGMVNSGKKSEFVGLSYQEQYNLIKQGKDILKYHGIDTAIFFAPSHSYDRNTLKALAANGFRYISDGKSNKPYILDGIVCIPCKSFGVPKVGGKGIYIAVNHAHEWRREDKKDDWTRFEKFCKSYSGEIVSYEELTHIPCGNSFTQYIFERKCVFYTRFIRPMLITVYHKVRSCRRGKGMLAWHK